MQMRLRENVLLAHHVQQELMLIHLQKAVKAHVQTHPISETQTHIFASLSVHKCLNNILKMDIV